MRLIDADALRDGWLENGENEYVYDTNAMLDSIDAQPTIDAVPVVHGRWIKTEEPIGWIDVLCGECSNCHESFIVDEDSSFDDFAMWNYCPNCGAKMDGEADG